MRLILHSGMRSRTLASQTCGSTPLSLAVSIRVQAMAAALPPLGEPMNEVVLPADGLMARSTGLLSISRKPCSRQGRKCFSRLSAYRIAAAR